MGIIVRFVDAALASGWIFAPMAVHAADAYESARSKLVALQRVAQHCWRQKRNRMTYNHRPLVRVVAAEAEVVCAAGAVARVRRGHAARHAAGNADHARLAAVLPLEVGVAEGGEAVGVRVDREERVRVRPPPPRPGPRRGGAGDSRLGRAPWWMWMRQLRQQRRRAVARRARVVAERSREQEEDVGLLCGGRLCPARGPKDPPIAAGRMRRTENTREWQRDTTKSLCPVPGYTRHRVLLRHRHASLCAVAGW
jgi:hypothetical protein